jgi:hypothetical protein
MGSSGVHLQWTPSNSSAITAFRVYFRNATAGAAFALAATLGASATSYDHGFSSPPSFGFTSGNVYEYKVEMDSN